MSSRMREVVGEYSTWYVCDVHGWDFTNEDEDVCPVCLGESLERDRFIKWIEANRTAIELEPGNFLYRDHFSSESLIAFIKGENK